MAVQIALRKSIFVIYGVLTTIILGAFGMAFFQTSYIYPSFTEVLVQNTESEATRTGHYLQKSILNNFNQVSYHLTKEVHEKFEEARDDFDLWKIKLFSQNGEIVYSTDKRDIGKINTKPYFHEFVSEGNTFTKIVKKDTKSLEGQLVAADVVETYIPVMLEGKFAGAFELYVDITDSKRAMDKLVQRNSWFIYILSTFVILLVGWSIVSYRNSLNERERFENQLEEERRLLEKSNQRLIAILNELPFSVALIDKKRKIRWGNRALFNLLEGVSEKDLFGKDCGDYLCPCPTSECPVLDLAEEVQGTESILLTYQKKKIPILKTILEVNIDGEALLLESFVDITERKKMEQELNLARKLESIGQLAAGIAHEINTPSQFIGSNLDFISDSTEDVLQLVSHYKDIVDKAKEQPPTQKDIESMDTLLDELDWEYVKSELPMAITQSQDGIDQISKIVLAMKEMSHPDTRENSDQNLNTLIENILTISRNEWRNDADIDLDLAADLPTVKCNPGEISQVLLNIIINAAHALRDHREEGNKGFIKISSNIVEDFAEIRIADSGPGIPKNIQDKVFDPFFTTKEVGKGTGQGLAIAFDIVVTKHDGKLSFESVEGQGTTFIVELPLIT